MNRIVANSLLIGFLAITASSCNEAKTTSEAPAPNSTNTVSNTPNSSEMGKGTAETSTNMPNNSANSTDAAKTDAQSDIRTKQLNADIRAREERNKVVGDPNQRDDSDLASEVRSKLEASIPGGNLTVVSKDAVVTVSGTVPKSDQLSKITKLGMEIKGVKSVMVKATVASK
jgi:hyperosmotically inducible periplasmic protein